jgi:uncharacterized protein YjeT (DUF2065 family)
MWQDFFTALALVFVIEGILPFLNPNGFRNTMRTVSELDDKTLRRLGLAAMLSGLLMLYLVR